MKYRKLHIVGLARVWNLASGLLLVFVASTVFSAPEQGHFYAFLSLAAAQYFFDLGVGFVLANIAGRNTPQDEHEKEYSNKELSNMQTVVRFALKWSAVSGSILILVLGAAGIILFSGQSAGGSPLWVIWLIYACFVGCSMCFHLFLRLFEGVGFVVEAALARSLQSFTNILVLYAFALAGTGIKSMVFAICVSLVVGISYFLFSSKKIRITFRKQLSDHGHIVWRRDVFPFQSKVAVTWIATYFIFQGQIPILYSLAGPVQAGMFGLAVQVFQALNTSANIFLTYSVREWTQLSSQNKMSELNRSLIKVTALTLSIVIIGCSAILTLGWVLISYNFTIAERFPDLSLLITYSVAACFNQVFFALGYYFRARGEEPLWWISVITALTVLAVPLAMGSAFNIEAATISFALATIVFFGLLAPIYSVYYIRKSPANRSLAEDSGADI